MDQYFPKGLSSTKLIKPCASRSLTEAKPGEPPRIVETTLISAENLLKPCEFCLFYFSANWCAPCRSLCKILVDRYKILKDLHGEKVEIILVSSDAEETEYDKSLASATWAAVPYDNEDLRQELPGIMNVEDIPTVVVVRCSDGKIVNSDAVATIASDTECKNYPWKPKTFPEVMAMATLVKLTQKSNDGNSEDNNNNNNIENNINYTQHQRTFPELIQNKKALGVYFSAGWCAPCEGFTALLGSIHKKLELRDPTAFEVCVVPGDRDKATYDTYMKKTCPFFSLPFNDPRISILNQMFGVSSIPTLIILNAQTGEIINPSAREDVSCDPDGQDCPWVPKPAPLLSSFEPTNACVEIFVNNPCVLLSLFDVDADRANEVLAQFREAAKEFREQYQQQQDEASPFSNVRFLVTKNKQEMDHADYTTCLKGHRLQPVVSSGEEDASNNKNNNNSNNVEIACDICGNQIVPSNTDNKNVSCKTCNYNVCSDCWSQKKAGQPKDAAFWQALCGDLGMKLEEEIPASVRKQIQEKNQNAGIPYVTKFSLKEGKSRMMKPLNNFEKHQLLGFFGFEL